MMKIIQRDGLGVLYVRGGEAECYFIKKYFLQEETREQRFGWWEES